MNRVTRAVRVCRGIVIVTLFAVALCFAGAALAASVTLNWTFNYTVDVACSTTVTKNCVSGFEYGTTADGGTTLAKIGMVANPTTTSNATAISTSFTQGGPYGAVVYYARTVGLDGSGNTIYSSAALASAVKIVPAAPTGLVVTVH
jgi:hypothetical protein